MDLNKLRSLINYSPYKVARQQGEYADISFEDEGIMTVPRNSAQSIVKLLNDAFKNGVSTTLKSIKLTSSEWLDSNFVNEGVNTTLIKTTNKNNSISEECINNYKK